MSTTPPPTVPSCRTERATPPRAPSGPVRIPSERLFAGTQEVLIEHRGLLYRLKKTALGKLILTK